MGRPPSLGICTPIPMVPVNPRGWLDGTDMRKRLALVTPEWHRARMGLMMPPGHHHVEDYEDGKEVGVARCDAVKHCREGGLRYLFFLDWDVIPPQDALIRLMYLLENNPEYGVASGVYCFKSIPTYPMIWREWGNGVSFDWMKGDVLRDQVVGMPMGCALIRLSLFDSLPDDKVPWFKTQDDLVTLPDGEIVGKSVSTEDLFFCKRYLGEAGGKMMVDTNVLCEHICHSTGRRYCLSEDSLPFRLAREATVAVA